METLTPQQFAEKYGKEKLNSFTLPSKRPSVLSRVVSDVPQDFLQMGEEIISQASQAGKNIVKTATSDAPLEDKVLDIGAEAFRRGGRIVSAPYLFALKVPFTQEAETTAGEVMTDIGTQIAEREGVQTAIGLYKGAPEPVKQGIQRVLGYGEGVAEILGLGRGTRAIREGIETTAKNVPPIKVPEFDYPKFNGSINDVVSRARVQLSDIDPKAETILKQQPNADKVNAYFTQAEKAAVDPAAPMATQLAADNAVLAYKSIESVKETVASTKAEAINAIADTPIANNIPGKALDTVKENIGSRFGVSISPAGEITTLPGRFATVDAPSQKLISDYVTMLRALGPKPTAKQLDDFVDASQAMLYKQSSPNLYEIADEPVIAFLKQQTGEINGQLKKSIDQALKEKGLNPIYSKLNERWATLNDVSERLNKRLGIEGDKGASLMKSLFSPQTGEPTRRLFEEIKAETGIDLFEEATLAKFAMESVGDPRSKSLLQSLDENAKKVSQLDLTKPMTWLDSAKEFFDLDGKELAEAIIKEANSLRKTP